MLYQCFAVNIILSRRWLTTTFYFADPETRLLDDDFSVKIEASNSVTIRWNSTILLKEKIEQLFLGVTSMDSEGKHKMLPVSVKSEFITVESLSPITIYRLTMREGSKNNPPLGLRTIKTWPLGKIDLTNQFPLIEC